MSRPWTVASSSGLLMGLATALPLVRGVDVAAWVQVAVPSLLAAAAGWTAWGSRGRVLLGAAAATWTSGALLGGSGPVAAVVLGAAVCLRLWAGVPELVSLGRRGALDLLADLTGGVCAAGLVLLTARGTPDQEPRSLALALVGGAVLVGLGAARLRREGR